MSQDALLAATPEACGSLQVLPEPVSPGQRHEALRFRGLTAEAAGEGEWRGTKDEVPLAVRRRVGKLSASCGAQ